MFRKLNALLWLRVQVLISNSTLLATLLMPFGIAVFYNEFLMEFQQNMLFYNMNHHKTSSNFFDYFLVSHTKKCFHHKKIFYNLLDLICHMQQKVLKIKI